MLAFELGLGFNAHEAKILLLSGQRRWFFCENGRVALRIAEDEDDSESFCSGNWELAKDDLVEAILYGRNEGESKVGVGVGSGF